jgi:hypothetical protein
MKTGKRVAGLAAMLVGIAGLAAPRSVEGGTPWQGQQTRTEGSGHVTSEDRAVSGFHAVSVSGVGTLTVTQGDRESLRVEADDNILPYIVSEVKDGRLELGIKSHADIHPTAPIRYLLTVKALDALTASGATEVEAGPITASNGMVVNVSGAAKMKLARLNAHTLKTELSGAGHFTLSGGVDTQEVQVSGAGEYQAEGLRSRDASVQTSGAGHAVITVSDALTASASGASSVRYVGSPRVTRSTSGVASVTSKNSD